MKKQIMIVLTCSLGLASSLFAANLILDDQNIATLRDKTPIEEQKKVSNIARPIADDVKIARNYPMQPPIIPHNIRDYQVDLNANTCLSCHSRARVSETQATMVSVTHYMDRDGNFLADISPRRYFCTQCHITQTDAKPLVSNEFTDMQTLLIKTLKDQEK
jgi:cytochrome c-type protein NapB